MMKDWQPSESLSKVPSLQSKLQLQVSKIRNGLLQWNDPLICAACLYGSCARGEATYRSDIDILVFANVEANWTSTNLVKDLLEKNLTLLEEPLQIQWQILNEEKWDHPSADLAC